MASISFCGECNNLLYPKEDKVHKVLMYSCRNCQYQEETVNPCVYRHDLIVTAKENAGVTQDLNTDPTLPRSNIECPRWSVFFGDQAKRTTTTMILFYNCTSCHKTFTDPKLGRR
ncbi:hypothetical protein JCM10212_004194 [Sporobolomyces blumeae]